MRPAGVANEEAAVGSANRPDSSAVARVAAYVRALDPKLPRAAWTLQLGFLVNAVGNGMVMPFLLIYLHNVRGFSLATAGLVVAAFGGASLLTTAVGGALSDRIDTRRVLAAALVLNAVGYGLFPLVHDPWHAFALMAVAGIGNGLFWPTNSSLLVAHTPEERRHAAFALNRATFNLGIGAGGLAGGLLATTTDPSTFTTLFVLDALTFVVYAALASVIPPAERAPASATARGGRYADVLRDRTFMAFVCLNAIFVIVAFAQLEATFPVFAKNEVGLSEQAIGLMFALNVAVIALAQLPIAKLLEGRRRMGALAAMTVIFAFAWVLTLAVGLWFEATLATVLLVVAILIFAVGECLHAPNQGALVADLAVPELRGRYFALSTYSYAVGFTVGPAVGGLLLGVSPTALWGLAAVACLAAGAASLALERRLPVALRRTAAATA